MQKSKKFISILLLLCFIAGLFVSVSLATEPKYIASKYRMPFHYSWCKWAKKILPNNAVYFETRE